MPTPATRTPVRIARGTYSNLNGSILDLQEGEICYATDQNKLYTIEGGVLTEQPYLANTGGTILNADINASAAIVDTKLATIATAGKVSNSATTAASANTASAIVARDASGNFTAGTITGSFNGTTFVGTTSLALNRSSANQGLTGISSVALPGATSGTVTVQPAAIAGTTTITLPATTGTVITTGDSGTVTSTMLLDGTILNADINASAAIAGSKIVAATTGVVGAVQLSDSTSTTSSVLAATPTAVKAAYDLAAAALPKSGGTVTGNLEIGTAGSLTFEGATADAFELSLAIVDPTADRTITLPDATGTVALLSAVQSYSAAQRGTISALTDGATITADFAAANNFSVTLGGNRTLANPSNQTAGQSGCIWITQDGTGSRTLAYGSQWDFTGGTAPTLSTAAASVDCLVYAVQSSTKITATLISNLS